MQLSPKQYVHLYCSVLKYIVTLRQGQFKIKYKQNIFFSIISSKQGDPEVHIQDWELIFLTSSSLALMACSLMESSSSSGAMAELGCTRHWGGTQTCCSYLSLLGRSNECFRPVLVFRTSENNHIVHLKHTRCITREEKTLSKPECKESWADHVFPLVSGRTAKAADFTCSWCDWGNQRFRQAIYPSA